MLALRNIHRGVSIFTAGTQKARNESHEVTYSSPESLALSPSSPNLNLRCYPKLFGSFLPLSRGSLIPALFKPHPTTSHYPRSTTSHPAGGGTDADDELSCWEVTQSAWASEEEEDMTGI